MKLGVFVQTGSPTGTQMLLGAASYVQQRPELSLSVYRLHPMADAAVQLRQFTGDGIILGPRLINIDQTWSQQNIPVVCCSYAVEHEHALPLVGFDNTAIGAAAAEHLVAEGLTELVFFWNGSSASSQYRWEGFQSRGSELGARVTCFIEGPRQKQHSIWSLKYQQQDFADLLCSYSQPVGVFAYDDTHAELAIEACTLAGLRISQDVGIICSSNSSVLCAHLMPPLSCIHIGPTRMVVTAAEWLQEASRDGTPITGARKVPIELQVRKSSSRRYTQDPLVARAIELMSEHLETSLNIDTLANQLHVSRRTLERRFQDAIDMTPAKQMRHLRVQATLKILDQADIPLKQVAARTGWSEQSHMTRAVREATGLTPLKYRQRRRAAPSIA